MPEWKRLLFFLRWFPHIAARPVLARLLEKLPQFVKRMVGFSLEVWNLMSLRTYVSLSTC